MGMKPLRFIRAWQTYTVGTIIRPTAAFAQTLVNNKICEYVVEEEKPKQQQPVVKPSSGATLTLNKKRGRRRGVR